MVNKRYFKYEQFDIIKFLDHYEIDYAESGKNIGSSWIGLEECPFCNIGNNHFGINLLSKNYSCFGCGEKGTPYNLIKELLGIPFSEVGAIIKQFYNGDLEFIPKESGDKVIMPSNIMDLQKSGANYLRSRNFNPFHIRDKYKIKQTGNKSVLEHEGKKSFFQNRLLRRLVSYTARDFTNKQTPKYQHVFVEACITPPSSCLYNIDSVKDKCIIVEGVTDVWRLGDGAISLQGIQSPKEQIRLIGEKNLKQATILFDAGKEKEATKLAKTLTAIVGDVRVAHLPDGDPGDLSEEDAIKIKYQLIGG